MKKAVGTEEASAFIDAKINELRDWRGKTFAKVRAIIHKPTPEIVEEVKWMGTPVFSHGGIVCTGETYKNVVKLTFAKGAALKDPAGLFNSSLDGNVRRAIDIHEGEKINVAALKNLIRAAVALNLEKTPTPRRASRRPSFIKRERVHCGEGHPASPCGAGDSLSVASISSRLCQVNQWSRRELRSFALTLAMGNGGRFPAEEGPNSDAIPAFALGSVCLQTRYLLTVKCRELSWQSSNVTLALSLFATVRPETDPNCFPH